MTVANDSSSGVGVVLPGYPVALTVTVNASGLAPQAAAYTGKVTIVASGAAVTAKSQTVTVNLTVNSSTPTIASTWPSTLPVNGGDSTITVFKLGGRANQSRRIDRDFWHQHRAIRTGADVRHGWLRGHVIIRSVGQHRWQACAHHLCQR
ncbi:MAG TPA: hypothetical protein VKX49_20715 [Bryobacteraceae bacterium]|nr:hypothetical protein [Bryobacteraceae bacterium]